MSNPTKINIKRLVSLFSSNILYGIGSDHQIYVHVPKRDLSIRVKEEIWENQRWNPVDGFCDSLLPTDRQPYSSKCIINFTKKFNDFVFCITGECGREPREKSDKLPSQAWQWECDWQIENTFENELIAEVLL